MMMRQVILVAAANSALVGAAVAQSPLTTGQPNNGRSTGEPGAFFDLTVGSDPVTITTWEYFSSSEAGTATEVSIYYKEGSYVGFDTDPGAWTLHDTVPGISAGRDLPAPIDPLDLELEADATYGIYFVTHSGGIRYEGSSLGPPPASYATEELTLEGDLVRTEPFGGSTFQPRMWSGSIHYDIGGGGATGLDVAIVAAAASTATDPAYTETQRVIAETGYFDSVDIVHLGSGEPTPTLSELQQYDAVLVWTNTTPGDNELLGDRLADYVDAGGGVVVAVFANSTTTTGRDIGGRWRSPEYEVIVPRSGNESGQASLGDVLDPSHPIMDGVSSFDGGSSSFRPDMTELHPGATAIAEWDDGRVLAAVGANEQRVDLGFYPPPSTVTSTFWNVATDGDLLMANALRFVAGGDTECYADCDASGDLDFFDFLCFQNEFAAGAAYADCDESGELDFFDFLCFQNEFAAGCP